MGKRRAEPPPESEDPDAPSPVAAGPSDVDDAPAEPRGPLPLLPPPITEPPVRLRRKDAALLKEAARKQAATPAKGTPSPFGAAGLNIPPSFVGARALFLLLRVGNHPLPVRLTFIGADGAGDELIESSFRSVGWPHERRAPGVYDVDLPSDRMEEFVTARPHLFRRVDAPGWLFGETVERASDRAEVAVNVDEPPTEERKRDLARLGFRLVGESEGELRGVILGRHLAGLLCTSWVGPIEVRKVHPQPGR
jgi:hypothetical protein